MATDDNVHRKFHDIAAVVPIPDDTPIRVYRRVDDEYALVDDTFVPVDTFDYRRKVESWWDRAKRLL